MRWFSWGFTWYYAIFPQLEQNAIFNSVNFSLSPADASSVLGGRSPRSAALLCPSESANLQLFASTNLFTLASGNLLLRR